ncbi:MAG: hypothetical protein ACPL4E_04255 [Thermoproteota archaeon]
MDTRFKEELVKTILLNSLTDAQALDVVNTLAKNVEWLKALSSRSRVEAARKITDYVKGGETCEEAIEKVKREGEEYVKNVENEITEFCSSISIYDAQLAKQVLELINCVKKNLGYDAAKWLLDVLKRVYTEALASNMGNRETASTKLRSVVEKAFKYPESIIQGCALASATVSELREKSIEQAWEQLNRIINYPDGIIVKCVLKQHKDNLRICIPKKKLAQYLGNEPCWIKLEVKGRTFYKNYGLTFEFDLPNDLGEEVEVTIIKITVYEFVETVLREANAPFNVAFSSGKYMLIVNGEEVCELLLDKDLHYDKTGDYGPAVIFAIMDYEGKEHSIKLVHKESKQYLCKVMISQFRQIKSVEYDEKRNKLIIEYFTGVSEASSEHEIFLESPKTALMRMAEEVRDLLNEGVPREDPRVKNQVGKIGQDYTRFYLEEEIREVVSGATGIPKEELKVFQGYQTEGPDFYVYHKTGLVAIVEIKTTATSSRYPRKCLDEGREKLTNYFTEERWNYLREAKFGIHIAIYLRDLDEIISTKFKEGVEYTIGDIVWNPNYGS